MRSHLRHVRKKKKKNSKREENAACLTLTLRQLFLHFMIYIIFIVSSNWTN